MRCYGADKNVALQIKFWETDVFPKSFLWQKKNLVGALFTRTKIIADKKFDILGIFYLL